MKVIAIAAMDEGRVIGLNNDLPWKLPGDLKRFSTLTRGHTVLMGRKTYESLPPKQRPLPDRQNVVITRSPEGFEDKGEVIVSSSPREFITQCRSKPELAPSGLLWIIGGRQIYEATMQDWDELYLTLVHSRYDGDTFFPAFEDDFKLLEEEPHEGFTYQRFVRP